MKASHRVTGGSLSGCNLTAYKMCITFTGTLSEDWDAETSSSTEYCTLPSKILDIVMSTSFVCSEKNGIKSISGKHVNNSEIIWLTQNSLH